jgi:Icc-related predicted phosphoesterase
MKICAISDLHGYLPTNIKECELLLIGGDISPLKIQFNEIEMWKWLNNEFLNWIKELPVNKVILIAGNHDYIFTRISNTKLLELQFNSGWKLKYLKNEVYNHIKEDNTILSIFGTPYCHIYGTWPFMVSSEKLKEKFSEVPDKIDILLTHDAPYAVGTQDISLERDLTNHCGNPELRERLEQVDFKWNIHGHIHTASHTPEEFYNGNVVNVSLNNEHYTSTFDPFYFEI